jgi:hypothetical protein
MRQDDELDRILSEDEEVLPSAGFAVSVMQAVRLEASTPPPLAFPWKRALPGLAAAAVALGLGLVQAHAAAGPGAAGPARLVRWLSTLVPVLEAAVAGGGHWIALALLLTYASVKLSMRLARNA